jgi:prolyl-tRNA synthetase
MKQMAGVYNYLPLGLRVLTKIQNIIREELDKVGAQEILMPAMTQEESYAITGRENMNVLFHMLGQGGTKLVLNPTHEEVVTPLVQHYTFSYQDLPVAVYQIQNKFRNEPRAKSGLLRGREFNMKDLYSFHISNEDLDAYYEKVQTAYHAIYARLGIGERTLLTYASGGDFSKYSHEFQTLSDIGEDTVHVCEKCRIAVNQEIIVEQPNCPQCSGGNLVPHKAIEVGNIFKLHRRFTDAFGFTFTDTNGQEQGVEMGCYGIGPSRIMGTLVEVCNDAKGIVWPKEVAPYQVHLIVLGPDDEVLAKGKELYGTLLDQGIEVLCDDRVDVSAGAKFADADLIGIPLRVVVSKKTLAQNGVEIKKRSESSAIVIPFDGAMGTIGQQML